MGEDRGGAKPPKASQKNSESSNSKQNNGDVADGEAAVPIPEQFREALEESGIPPEEKEIIISEMEQSLTYRGPLPPPSMLRDYGDIDSSFPDRIVRMAENEQSARHRFEGKIRNTERWKLGGALIVSLALIAASAFAAYIGSPWLAGVLGVSGVLTSILRWLTRAYDS